MRIKELITILRSCDQNAEIFISVDEEGNDFKPIIEVLQAPKEEPYTFGYQGDEVSGYIIWPEG